MNFICLKTEDKFAFFSVFLELKIYIFYFFYEML